MALLNPASSLSMMREFLETYGQAINLDGKQYDYYFPEGVKRADFLLFDEQVVCEIKEIKNIEIPSKVEKLASKRNLSELDLKRDLYASINRILSKANKQLGWTKNALSCPDAFGLIILENFQVENLSVLSLLCASERKMVQGLVNVDCVLCFDSVNAFSNLEQTIRLAQTIARDSEKARQLYKLTTQLMRDFCNSSNSLLFQEINIDKGAEKWLVDRYGKFKKYEAKVDFKLPVLEAKPDWRQQLAQVFRLLAKLCWIISLLAVLRDWFIP